ncbi:MAG TPA: cyclic nucleotide-binding domain-containing protein [Luteolibacter sp.]|nr:cyclic nucleotide-binding domain-containing protein [Luteolibacter sp.]
MQEILDQCQGLEEVTFAAGDVILPEGETTGRLYILISGALEVIKGESPITVLTEPGSLVGDGSALLECPHPVTVAAAEETRCYVAHDARNFLASHPELTFLVAEVLARRLKGMIGYLADLRNQYKGRNDQYGSADELLLHLAHRTPKR